MTGRRRSMLALGLLTSGIYPAFSAIDSETVNYTYDPRGRLVQVSRSGAVNDGVQASYTYDKADNRINVTVSGPGFSVTDASATEGVALGFTVSRTVTSSSMSVSYATSNGSATAGTGNDYTAASGTLNFAVGEQDKTVTVSTYDDAASESPETFTLTLSNPVGGAIIDGSGTGTINDNDAPGACNGVSFAINDYRNDEGTTFTFNVTKSGTATGSCSVDYATATGTAGTGDFTATSGTLTFASNETTKPISVVTNDDAKTESTETFSVNLSAATGGAIISDAQGIGTIDDNDCGTCLVTPPPPEEE